MLDEFSVWDYGKHSCANPGDFRGRQLAIFQAENVHPAGLALDTSVFSYLEAWLSEAW
jgi:hypothetical protein